jgi:hypothetical protein
MNKYLLMSAAAVLASTGAANAGTYTFTFGTAGGGSYCDGGQVTTGVGGGQADAWIHENANCASATSQGAGLLGKNKNLSPVKFWGNSDNYLAKLDGIYNEQLAYNLDSKIKTGAAWTLWIGLSGFTNFEGNSGVLNNVSKGGAHFVKSHSKVSTAAKVAQLVKSHQQ